MPTQTFKEFAAGVIVFRTMGTAREYLLLRSVRGHWEFPKGHLRTNETWIRAALRELKEEAGITDALTIPGFSRQIQYYFHDRRRGLVHKTVAFVITETRQTGVALSKEHDQAEFLPFEHALKRITHAGLRELLRDGDKFIAACDDWNSAH